MLRCGHGVGPDLHLQHLQPLAPERHVGDAGHLEQPGAHRPVGGHRHLDEGLVVRAIPILTARLVADAGASITGGAAQVGRVALTAVIRSCDQLAGLDQVDAPVEDELDAGELRRGLRPQDVQAVDAVERLLERDRDQLLHVRRGEAEASSAGESMFSPSWVSTVPSPSAARPCAAASASESSSPGMNFRTARRAKGRRMTVLASQSLLEARRNSDRARVTRELYNPLRAAYIRRSSAGLMIDAPRLSWPRTALFAPRCPRRPGKSPDDRPHRGVQPVDDSAERMWRTRRRTAAWDLPSGSSAPSRSPRRWRCSPSCASSRREPISKRRTVTRAAVRFDYIQVPVLLRFRIRDR